MPQHNLWRIAGLGLHIDPRAIDRVAAWRIATIGPIEDAVFQIELQIDWLRQAVEQHFDISAVGRGLALGNFDVGAKQAAQSAFARAFLRPVDLPVFGVDGDSNPPSGLIAALILATARLDK